LIHETPWRDTQIHSNQITKTQKKKPQSCGGIHPRRKWKLLKDRKSSNSTQKPATLCLRKSVTQIIDIHCVYVRAQKQSERIVRPKFIIYRQKQETICGKTET
jgi:hypothetical protein